MRKTIGVIKENSKFIKYSILAIFLALQSTDLLHEHHGHDHDEGDYCFACHTSNIDHDIVLQSSGFSVGLTVITVVTLITVFIKKNKLSFYQLPRSPPAHFKIV